MLLCSSCPNMAHNVKALLAVKEFKKLKMNREIANLIVDALQAEGIIKADVQLRILNYLDSRLPLLLQQCNVSGELPVSETIKEIENLMERWHLARDNDDETLQGINDALVKIGLLGWFNRQ